MAGERYLEVNRKMNAIDNIKEKIKNKIPVIGTAVTMNDSSITELLSDIGFDFIWIDTEHTPLDKKDVHFHIMAARGTGSATFVRVAWNDPVLVKPILEMGPSGIIFPFIKTASEARKAVRSCLYPPKGIRGFGPRRSIKYGITDIEKYIKRADTEIWKIMQIEHIDAVKNLEEILNIGGVDAIMIGPNDLAASIGYLGQNDHPEVKKIMDIASKKIVKSGKPFGISIGYDPATIKEWIERGVNYIEVGCDVAFLLQAGIQAFKKTKKIFIEGKAKH